MFIRKIESILHEWKNTPNHRPLVIKGVRQCGKTFSVRRFAGQNWRNVIYLDFREHPEYRRFFLPNLDVSAIIMRMSATPELQRYEFVPGETCLVMDEIQDCPLARSSLKYFCLDGRFDVICTGSLLGVSGYRNSDNEIASIPVGYEHIIEMRPMDFEEWLWANGVRNEIVDYLKQAFVNETPIDPAIDEVMNAHLLNYIAVGGMPEVVTCFVETRQMGKVLNLQRKILDEYRGDMLKYASQADKGRIVECFDSIPSQLAKKYKKFTFSSVRANSRGRDYAGCLNWIEDAGIIKRCYNIRCTELPLDGQRIGSEFKVYMADIGLLVAMMEDGTQMSILQGELGTYKGAIYENLMADMLGKMGRRLYYFRRDSGLELDFVIRYRNECVPVECKATSGKSKSLKTVLKNNEVYHVSNAIKVGRYNIGRSDGILTIPAYLAFLLV